MFYVYSSETKKVEKVEKIDPKIHFHRNTKEAFTLEAETPVKKVGKTKSK